MDRIVTGTVHRESDTGQNPPGLNLRTLKPWAYDQKHIDDGYSVTVRLANGQTTGQFGLINVLSVKDDGTFWSWSANDAATTITHNDWLRIGGLQVPDAFTRQAKMKWLSAPSLSNGWGSPINAVVGSDWRDVTGNIRQINAVYAGNVVNVLETKIMTVRWQGVFETVPMCRIQTFESGDWGNLAPHLVHEVWGVNLQDEPYPPKGKIYLPIICKTAQTWVMERWLLP